MIIRVLPNQIKDHKDIIDKTMNDSFPETAMATKTSIYRDIMLDLVDVWFYMIGEEIKIVFITRLNNDYSVGRKTMTILASRAFTTVTEEMFVECFNTVKKVAKSKDCYFLDFYTDNKRIIEAAEMFPVFWKASYYQLSLEN